MARKRRVPIPPEVSAAVRHASDNTCCKCRNPGQPVQIHHIDEDPANNTPVNLAVLCLTCHDQTQTHGGFGRRLDAPLVIKYRDEWLEMVRTKRSQQAATAATVRSDDAWSQGSAPERAREKAAYLRELYAEFLAGMGQMLSVAESMQWVLEHGEDVGEQLNRLEPTLAQAGKRLVNTAHRVRVEPGADKVCAAYDEYQALSKEHMHYIFTFLQAPSAIARLSATWSVQRNTARQLRAAFHKMEVAVRQHIASAERLP